MFGELFESSASADLFFQLCLQERVSRTDRNEARAAPLRRESFGGWLRKPHCDARHRPQLIANLTLAAGSDSRARYQNLSGGACHLDRITQIGTKPVESRQDFKFLARRAFCRWF